MEDHGTIVRSETEISGWVVCQIMSSNPVKTTFFVFLTKTHLIQVRLYSGRCQKPNKFYILICSRFSFKGLLRKYLNLSTMYKQSSANKRDNKKHNNKITNAYNYLISQVYNQETIFHMHDFRPSMWNFSNIKQLH